MILLCPLTFVCWFPLSFGVFVGFLSVFVILIYSKTQAILHKKWPKSPQCDPTWIPREVKLLVVRDVLQLGVHLWITQTIPGEKFCEIDSSAGRPSHKHVMDKKLTLLLTATIKESPCLALPASCSLFKTDPHFRHRKTERMDPSLLCSPLGPHWTTLLCQHHYFSNCLMKDSCQNLSW